MLGHQEDSVIIMEELFTYVSAKTGIDMEIVMSVLDSEMDFLTSGEVAGNEKVEKSDGEKAFIDKDEMNTYIVKNTNVAKEIVVTILDCEMQYLDSKGLLEYGDNLE